MAHLKSNNFSTTRTMNGLNAKGSPKISRKSYKDDLAQAMRVKLKDIVKKAVNAKFPYIDSNKLGQRRDGSEAVYDTTIMDVPESVSNIGDSEREETEYVLKDGDPCYCDSEDYEYF